MATIMNDKISIIEVKNIKKSFKQNDRQDLLVLDDVNLELYEGEIVALLEDDCVVSEGWSSEMVKAHAA